jgi:Ca2+-binding RTX toxin-like protein
MRRLILLLMAMAVTLVVASGVAWAVNKIGTDGPDTLRGTNGDDNLIGRGGNDFLVALNGRDNLVGGPGKDWVVTHPTGFRSGDKNLVGGPGNDGIEGGLGSDNALGGTGNDFVHGDKGSDRLTGEEGRDLIQGWTGSDRMVGGEGGDVLIDGALDESSKNDVLSGGDGNDVFFGDNVPAVKDIVSCDGGFDWAVVDRKDVVGPNCERVRVVHGTEAEVLRQEEAFVASLPRGVREFFDVENNFDKFFEQLAPFPQ